jgi:2-phospho-L-lactate guanylyltransferase (CobY/MobA/RfbA family)
VVADLAIAFDVDTPEDLADLTAFHHDIAVLLRVAVGPRT